MRRIFSHYQKHPGLRRIPLLLGSMALLAFGAIFAVGRYYHYHPDQVPDYAALETVWWISLITAALSLASGALALVAFPKHRLSTALFLIPGLLISIYFAAIGILTSTPSLSLQELKQIREQARPLIEEITGKGFLRPVPIQLTTTAEYTEKARKILDKEGLTDISTPLPLGLYDPEEEVLFLMPDGLARFQEYQGWFNWEARSYAYQTLIHEMVHALDHQHGHIPGKAKRMAERAENPDAFLIRRALEEGHSQYVSLLAANRLGFSDPTTTRRSFPDRPLVGKEVEDAFWGDTFKLIYEEGSGFMASLYEKGRLDLVKEVFDSPPRWRNAIRHPEIFIRDRDTGHDVRFEKVCQDLSELARGFGMQTNLDLSEIYDLEAGEEGETSIGYWMAAYHTDDRSADNDMSHIFGNLFVTIWRFASVGSAKKHLKRIRQEEPDLFCGQAGSYVMMLSATREENEHWLPEFWEALQKECLLPLRRPEDR